MLVCVSTHTQQSLSSRSLAYSGSEVFSFQIVMSLANDSIWYLICKIYNNKKWWHRKRGSTVLVSSSTVVTSKELQLSLL